MKSSNRTVNGVTAFALIGNVVTIGACLFWTTSVNRSTSSEVALALHQQSAQFTRQAEEMSRLAERLASFEQASLQVARLANANAGTKQGLSPEQVGQLSAQIATHLNEERPPAAPAEPPPQSLLATASAKELIVAATASHHWTEADQEKMRGFVAAMTGEQQLEVLRQLSVAINEQKIKLDTIGLL